MNANETILRVLQILTAWPVVTLVLVLVFRRQIAKLLEDLGRRLKRASVAGSSFEFADPAMKAMRDALVAGAEKLKDKPEELATFVRKQAAKLPVAPAAPAAEIDRPLRGHSILWVDDDPEANLYEVGLLGRMGAGLTYARSTAEARRLLESRRFDAVVSDVRRIEDGADNPRAGYELLATVQTLPSPPPVVLYASGSTPIDHARASAAVAAVDRPAALVEAIRQVVEE